MKQYCKIYPETGFLDLSEPDVISEVALEGSEYVPGPAPGGFYRPRWDGEKWVEGGTAPDPVPTEPTIEERLAAVEAATLDLILGGAL